MVAQRKEQAVAGLAVYWPAQKSYKTCCSLFRCYFFETVSYVALASLGLTGRPG